VLRDVCIVRIQIKLVNVMLCVAVDAMFNIDNIYFYIILFIFSLVYIVIFVLQIELGRMTTELIFILSVVVVLPLMLLVTCI